MSVKFLHTADWHMGMKASEAGAKAKEVRAKRFRATEGVVEVARRERVQFVLLAGDLFDNHKVDTVVVLKTVEVLNQFAPTPVFVLPGNHDPFVPGGVWDLQSWGRCGEHVRLLREAAEVEVQDGVVLYPAPLKQKQSVLDPTAWIPARKPDDRRIRIGVAHGNLGIFPEHPNFPIATTRAEEAGLDYLALGEWHGFVRHGRTVYPGTIEQTRFGEKETGNVAIVEIREAGANPVVTLHRVGTLRWEEHRPSIRDSTDVDQLRRAVLAAGPLSEQLLRVIPRLEPGISLEVLDELRARRAEFEREAFYLDWPEHTLDAIPEGTVTIPEGLLAEIDEGLAAVLDGRTPDGPMKLAVGQPPATVAEARALLRRLVAEVQR